MRRSSKDRKKAMEWEWYRLQGVSFTILPHEERDYALADFASLLAAAREGGILVRRTEKEERYFDYRLKAVETEFFLKAKVGGIPLHFGAEKIEKPPRPEVKALLNPLTLLLEDGSLARMLVVHRYPLMLPEGVLFTLFAEAREIAILFKEVERSRAVSLVERARRRRESSGGGSEEEFEEERLSELASRILGGSSLFEFHVLLTVSGEDLRSLNAREKRIRSLLRGYGMDAEPPPIQTELYNLSPCFWALCIEKRYADLESLKALFPFIDEELHERGGVFLGMSGTGSPVLLDLWSKPNLNFVILGATGSGKSMTAKLYLKRLRSSFPEILYVGIDPEGEYARVAGSIGARSVEIREGDPLGLDPLKLMRSGALELGQVADILGEVYGIPDHLAGVLRKELFMRGELFSDLAEFSSGIRDRELSRYLQGAEVPPDSSIFRGDPPALNGSVVFNLKGIRSRRLKVLISALISSYMHSRLFTRARRSVLFVDEAWLFMETPSILSLFESIARRGRKHGTAFIYISQRAEDLIRNPQGRAILEQSATVLLMRQEQQGVEGVKNIYRLSEAEAGFLSTAPVGSGILKTWRKRITVRVLATEEEKALFSTSVK